MSTRENDKVTIGWTDYRGKEHSRDVNQIIDVRDFIGTPGYSLLVVAANTNMSISDIVFFLGIQARKLPSVERSRSWIQRRRWLFQQPDTVNMNQSNRDGNEARAIRIMAEYPSVSIRDLVLLLKDNRIPRSYEWVRKNRSRGAPTDNCPPI